MTGCKIPNFDKNSVNITFKKGGNVDSYKTEIKEWIDSKKWFPKDEKDSEQPGQEWEDSINKLFDLIKNKSRNKDWQEAVEQLRTEYLIRPIIPAEEDSNISPEIPDGDLPKKDVKRERKLREDTNAFFNGDRLLLDDFQTEFKNQIFGLTIVRVENSIDESNIINSVRDVNVSIIKFLNEQYKIIYNFLKERGVELKGINPNMFVMESKDERGLYKKNPSYSKLLEKFYEYLTNKENYSDLSKVLQEDYERKFQNINSNYENLNAAYAYLNIKYFNELLEKNYGKYISINKKQNQIISIEDDRTNYKYTISRSNSQLSSGWETNAVRDGLKEIGSFSTTVMESIPVIDSIKHLSKNEFIVSLLKLRRAIENGNSDNGGTIDKLKVALAKSVYNTVEGWKEVLEIVNELILRNNIVTLIEASKINVFSDDNKTQKGSQLTQIDINNIKSIYNYLFNKNNGIYYIQRNSTFSDGISRGYDIISSLFGSIQSSTFAHYLEVVYDYDKKKYVTRIKSKNNSYNDVHAIKKSINTNTIYGTEEDPLFKLDSNTGEVGYGPYIIVPNNTRSEYGIFDLKRLSIEKIKGIDKFKTLDSYFKDQLDKLHSVGSINNLLKSKDPKDISFINLLKFIDSNLTTDFSTGLLGLQTLRTLQLVSNSRTTILQDLYLNALRAASAKKLNIKLKNKDEDSELNNIEYIKAHSSEFPYKFVEKIDKNSHVLRLHDEEYWFSGVENSELFDDIVKAKNIINRSDTKGTTKNSEGNSIPNISVYFTNIIQEFYKQGENPLNSDNSSYMSYITKNLLFSGNKSNSILITSIDEGIKTYYGENKSIDQCSNSELFYHSFMDKFILPMQNNLFVSQPITYSDKKKFLLFTVSLDSISGYRGKNIFMLPNSLHERIMNDTIGQYYRDLFAKVVQDYRDVFNLDEKLSDRQVFFEANRLMKSMSEQELIELVKSKSNELGKDIKFYKDLHYRNISKNENDIVKISTNEILLYYVNNVFSNLSDFLAGEKANYINNLLNSYTLIKSDTNISDLFKNKIRGTNYNQWTDNGYLILAKRKGIPVKFGSKITKQEILNGDVVLNPLLNTYFYISNVVNNNIKLGLVGHELHHKIKELKNLTKDLNKDFNTSNQNIVEIQETIEDLKQGVFDLEDMIRDPLTNEKYDDNKIITFRTNSGEFQERTVGEITELIKQDNDKIKELSKKVDDTLYQLISLAQNAQFKRTVAIPGTIRPYDQGKIDGITSSYNVAFINDVKALINDFKGDYGWTEDYDEDAHDGSAWIDPFTSIHENNSLDDSEVGKVKKPLWDIDDPIYGARGLIKYAVNSITNNLMLKSIRSTLSLHKLFKKMTDIQWGENEIDLIDDWSIVPYSNTAFSTYIINDENQLYYKTSDNSYKQIINFGKDDNTGVYYTEEVDVRDDGRRVGTDSVRVYHLFEKGTSKHIRVREIPANWNENYTRINSLFQLHAALGGIYSCSLSNGKLIYSEASNKAVSQFMNYVSRPTELAQQKIERGESLNTSQSDFYQPLKYKLINCIVNDSAVKNGASNINPSSSYYDDSKLNYVRLSTAKYGIQQDSDHEADEAQLTEMTQVISALDATGLYHDEVYDIYNAIGQQIINSLQLEIEALSLPKDQKNKLYDLVGKTIINNFKDRKGMLKAILDQLEEVFNLTTDHKFDKTLCPFSDATLYNKIIQVLGSIINRKAIKRTYSGSGMVMVPAYDIYQIWEIDGKPLQYEDVLKEAIKYNKSKNNNEKIIYDESTEDVEDYNKRLIDAYLSYKLPDETVYELSEESDLFDIQSADINPENVITITYTYNGEKKTTKPIRLDSISKYYEFKFNTKEFLAEHIGIDKNYSDLIIVNNVIKNNSIPRNLAPARIKFTYVNNSVENTINIFDSKIYKELYKAKKSKDVIKEQLWKGRIKTFLENLENNIYTEWNSAGVELKYKIIKKDTRLAETIMSNIYKSNFNIKDGDSLYDVLQAGPDYFNAHIQPLDGSLYDFDIQLITETGKNNVYISLDSQDNNNGYETRQISWKRSHMNKVRISDKERGNSKVLNRIYLINDDNLNQFEIGREIDVSDEITYDYSKKKFFNIKTKEEVKDRKLYLDGDKVVEYFEFITQNRIVPKEDISFKRYNINQESLKRVLLPKETLEQQISKIIEDFYNSDSFLMIQPSYNIKAKNYFQVRKIFKYLKDNVIDEDFRDYCDLITEEVFTFSSDTIKNNIKTNSFIQLNSGLQNIFRKEILEKYGIVREENEPISKVILKLRLFRNSHPEYAKEINNLLRLYERSKLEHWNYEFMKKHSKKKFISFQKSLDFISSRIPAQTLQSFMAMKCVGYMGVDTNYCAVTHFQTFLQGSDYDIDKSYMMGLNFDENGIYQGWSNLFDYSSRETLEASEKLPLSKGYTYVLDNIFGLDITKDVNDIFRFEEHSPERIIAISKLLKKIYRHSKLSRYKNSDGSIRLRISNEENADNIINILNSHEKTILPTATKDAILKNFISSHIQQISSSLGNLDESYTPVEMKELREPSKNTPKSKLARSLTLFNPAMINVMQFQNMAGKQVTGIAANAQKALFMWRTATLEALNKYERKEIDDAELSMVIFNVSLEGIKGRNSWEENVKKFKEHKIKRVEPLKEVTITCLPNLRTNVDFYKEALKNGNILFPKISSDNIGSQYISAATDNAKELILAAINAGNKMAKCHLYLMSLGFDVVDIVRFMTSDAVSFIDSITDKNIFINFNLDINYAIQWAIDYLDDPNNGNTLKGVVDPLVKAFQDKLNEISRSPEKERFYKDLITLQKVLAGANEFSNFGRILGINQGVPQTKEDLIAWKNGLKNIIRTAEKKLINKKSKSYDKDKLEAYGVSDKKYDPVRGKNFDPNLWLSDPEYRKLTEEYYNKIKESLNIFYYIDNIPHFKEMFKGVYIVNEIDSRISLKGQLVNEYSIQLRDAYPYAPENYEKKFEIVFNELFIEKFIKNMNLTISDLDENWKMINRNGQEVNIGSDKLVLKDDASLASFKYIFEQYIIPKLKNGTLIGIESPQGKDLYSDPNIREFLNGLVLTDNDEIPCYKANLNMTLKDVDFATRLKYTKFLRGIKELQKYKWGGHNIGDLFVIYNLIVNKNQYGSERLTELFEDFITDFENKKEQKESYIMKYLRYLGDQDYHERILQEIKDSVTLTDLLAKVAPTVSYVSINKVRRSDPIIKTFSQEFGIVYYENVGYSNYEPIPSFTIPIEGETMKDYKRRQRNQYKYSFGLPYVNYIRNLITSLKSISDSEVQTAFNELVVSGVVKYKIKCDG